MSRKVSQYHSGWMRRASLAPSLPLAWTNSQCPKIRRNLKSSYRKRHSLSLIFVRINTFEIFGLTNNIVRVPAISYHFFFFVISILYVIRAWNVRQSYLNNRELYHTNKRFPFSKKCHRFFFLFPGWRGELFRGTRKETECLIIKPRILSVGGKQGNRVLLLHIEKTKKINVPLLKWSKERCAKALITTVQSAGDHK